MSDIKNLFANNKAWAERKHKVDPKLFETTSKGQSPKYFWIGCSDSRVPAEQLLDLKPGELFVHRNVANLCPHSDMNFLSALQFGVEHLKVEHIIVCGHSKCGGVHASMQQEQFGIVDNWIRHIRDVSAKEQSVLEKISDPEEKLERLIELNVLHQVMNVCRTTIVQNAWKNGHKLSVHGLVYDLKSGLLKDLGGTVSSLDQVDKVHRTLKLH